MKSMSFAVICLLIAAALLQGGCARQRGDQNKTFDNPVLHADYSDPDVIRSGDNFYMVASSFNCVPGLPVLHSTDLVSWNLIGYALDRLRPEEYYSEVRHGGGVWAPCIRIHRGVYYIYYPDPDYGIFMVSASDPSGPWSEPVRVIGGKGLIDPSPLWDEDGNAYLVYAYAGSRSGVKSVLMVTGMSYDGTTATGSPVLVFDGHDDNPTVEGPKFYKRNGWYYIFAPAGGVTAGWQLVLRSRNIFGPYEHRMVMHQGSTAVNGPHQGAWITTRSGEDWFIHFQDKGAYGRIVHLQPVKWSDDWPVIGADDDGDGTGEPVLSFTMPVTGHAVTPGEDEHGDEFEGSTIPLDWQWHANPRTTWGYPSPAYGCFRLNCIPGKEGRLNMWEVPNLFLRKLPAERFTATASVNLNLRYNGEEAGMIVMGRDYGYLSVRRTDEGCILRMVFCDDADRGTPETECFSHGLESDHLLIRLSVDSGAICRFSYSTDGEEFIDAGGQFTASGGMWIGAKVGFFALREGFSNDAGSIDINWFRILTTD